MSDPENRNTLEEYSESTASEGFDHVFASCFDYEGEDHCTEERSMLLNLETNILKTSKEFSLVTHMDIEPLINPNTL